ncbi:MAG: PmeII family type II restriction endonuclease [Nitrososphaerales archaeon]
MPLTKQAKAEITKRIRAFVKKNITKVDGLHLDGLAINPYLVETMGLGTPEEIVEFFVNQRFQRGVVTSFGSLFEKQIAGYFGEAAGIGDVDLKFDRKGVTYYVQLKSGPEGFTGPALTKTLNTMKDVKKQYPGSIPVIAFSYGTKSKLSKVWGPQLETARRNGDVEVMIGREFWNFVLQDARGYEVLFEIFKEAGVADEPTLFGEKRTLENARKDVYGAS